MGNSSRKITFATMLFQDIIGQEAVKQRLIRSVLEQRISHAQLITGAAGSGKLPLALAYATYINCKNRTEHDACGVCPSCIKFKKFIHPDLHFVYPTIKNENKEISRDYLPEWRSLLTETNGYFDLQDWYQRIEVENKQGVIYAKEAEDIIKTLNRKSYESEYKIMIIWKIEKLQYQAAPKLLKLFEEPPEKTLFLLITENPEEILSTIISRTQMVRVHRIDDLSMRSAISHHYNEKDETSIQRIIHLSEGNWLNVVKHFSEEDNTQRFFEMFKLWTSYCYKGQVAEASVLSEDFSKMGREQQKAFFAYCLQMMQWGLQNLAFGKDKIKTTGDELEFISKCSSFFTKESIPVFSEMFEEAEYHIERNANPNILFMDISLKSMTLMFKTRKKI